MLEKLSITLEVLSIKLSSLAQSSGLSAFKNTGVAGGLDFLEWWEASFRKAMLEVKNQIGMEVLSLLKLLASL